MTFHIRSIYAKWFEVEINRQFILTNSYYLGCDAPKRLLKAFANLLEKGITTQWLCWQDEPDAYILKIENAGGQCIGEIYNADAASFVLEHEGVSLADHTTECVYRFECDMKKMSSLILREFSLYENGNGRKIYQEHWGDFPQTEYEKLKQLLKRNPR